ncbi:MAG: phosphate signaling complex PhoU family protein, partial [Nitrosopumilaceae archaeon]
MTRLIDPHLDELSLLMAQMGDLAAKSINLALDSYIVGKNARTEVYEISRQISNLYDQVGNLTFEMIL